MKKIICLNKSSDLAEDSSTTSDLIDLSFTSDEMDLLELFAIGLSDLEIRRKLDVTQNHIRRHKGNILTKLNVTNRTELIRFFANNCKIIDDSVVDLST